MMRARCSRSAGQVFREAVVGNVAGFYAERVLNDPGSLIALRAPRTSFTALDSAMNRSRRSKTHAS